MNNTYPIQLTEAQLDAVLRNIPYVAPAYPDEATAVAMEEARRIMQDALHKARRESAKSTVVSRMTLLDPAGICSITGDSTDPLIKRNIEKGWPIYRQWTPIRHLIPREAL
jgi:hypothetical protein